MSASSSMHSWSIMVESMSAIRNGSAAIAGVLNDAIDRGVVRSAAAQGVKRLAGRHARGQRQVTRRCRPPASRLGLRRPTCAPYQRAAGGARDRPGWAMSVATSGMDETVRRLCLKTRS